MATYDTVPAPLKKLAEFSVIPDLIDSFDKSVELHIMYGHHAVHYGNLLPWRATMEAPVILSMEGANTEALYTLILVDLDAPSENNPAFREWRHWMVSDIPGGDILRGKELSAYSPAEPGLDTGIHRYAFVLFQQKGPLNLEPLPDYGAKRGWFKTRKFAEEHGLTPVGCNFFRAHYMVHSDVVDIDMARIVSASEPGGKPEDQVY